MPDKRVLIACSMIEDEINEVIERKNIKDLEVRWQERGLHSKPDALHSHIQNEIDKAEADGADVVLLAYGLCGQGAEGWCTRKAKLAMPRFDDCVNMMLCTDKRDRRNYLKAGHMYLTRGWSNEEGALLTMLDEARTKYGDRRGTKAIRLMFDSYTDVDIIENGCYDTEPIYEYADKCAEALGLGVCSSRGGNIVLEKLICGIADEDIIVKEPSESIRAEDFEFGGERNVAGSQMWKEEIVL